MAETHYIELSECEKAIFRGKPTREVKALCGAYVPREAHANDPNCPNCLHRLELLKLREADDRRTARALEIEYPEFSGRLAIDDRG